MQIYIPVGVQLSFLVGYTWIIIASVPFNLYIIDNIIYITIISMLLELGLISYIYLFNFIFLTSLFLTCG